MKFSAFRAARAFTLAAVFGAFGVCAHSADLRADYLSRSDVRTFIEYMQAEHGLESSELERVLGAVRFQPTVVRLIGPERPKPAAPVVRSYPAYRAKFLTKARIAAGVRYWELHSDDLHRAETQYEVPAEVILGILGVETAYGRNTGSFRVLDALATIAFDGPRRQDYFRDELKELLHAGRLRAEDVARDAAADRRT